MNANRADPPLHLRLRLIHAALQLLADDAGADVLHVKGPAVADELLDTHVVGQGDDARTVTVPRTSSDADILVRPEHVSRFLRRIERAGWIRKTHFGTGSAFGHALNVYHPQLGNADIHRAFPGLPDESFAVLWERRTTKEMGQVACTVPDLVSQRLILLLHAARSGPHHPDRDRAWHRATDDEKAAVRTFAREVGGEMGLAAALGELDQYRDHPNYELWRHFSTGEDSRLGEWRARWRAARTMRQKVDFVRGLAVLDTALLEAEIGRPPTRRDVRRRNLARWATLIKEVRARVTGKGRQ